MELQFLPSQFFFIFPWILLLLRRLIFALMVLKLAKRSKYNNRSPKLPPGPRKSPLVGNMHQFVGSLPHHCLRDSARKQGPLMHLQLGELSYCCCFFSRNGKRGHENPWHYFRQPAFSVGNRYNKLQFHGHCFRARPYGDCWRQLCKICTSEFLSSKRVQSLRSIKEQELSNLIKSTSISERSPITLKWNSFLVDKYHHYKGGHLVRKKKTKKHS